MKKLNLNPSKKIALACFSVVIGLSSCVKEDVTPDVIPVNTSDGVYIVNEGVFGGTAGTITIYDPVTDSLNNDIFEQVNGFPLGDVVQSMEIIGEKGYIVVNNSNKVEVVTLEDFKSAGTITGVSQPRYFLGVNSTKGYVSEWVDGNGGNVKVVDLATNTVTKTIATANGAERMVNVGGFVYVACSGGFGEDSLVAVIDPVKDSVVANINVGANPSDLHVDANGKLWVLCEGTPDYSDFPNVKATKAGALVRINTATNTVEETLTLSNAAVASSLVINADKNVLYYSFGGKVYAQDIDASTVSTSAVIDRKFYGLGVDPVEGYLYAGDAKDNNSDGLVIRYDNNLNILDSFAVGISPVNFIFR